MNQAAFWLIPNPRDIAGFIKELMKYKVNSFPAVNTLYNGLMHHPDFKKIDFSGLKISSGGGMALSRGMSRIHPIRGGIVSVAAGFPPRQPVAVPNSGRPGTAR